MRKKYNKADILSTGERLVREKGYHNTGINDILKVCGIPKGSFYNFFKSKEDFCYQIIGVYAENMTDQYRLILSDTRFSPLQRIRHLYEMIIRSHVEEQFRNGCLLTNLASEIGGLNPDMGEEIDRRYQGWLDLLAACIASGQEAGEITPAYPPRQLAEYLHNSFYGSFALMKAQRSARALELSLQMGIAFISDK